MDATALPGSGPVTCVCRRHRDRCRFGRPHRWNPTAMGASCLSCGADCDGEQVHAARGSAPARVRSTAEHATPARPPVGSLVRAAGERAFTYPGLDRVVDPVPGDSEPADPGMALVEWPETASASPTRQWAHPGELDPETPADRIRAALEGDTSGCDRWAHEVTATDIRDVLDELARLTGEEKAAAKVRGEPAARARAVADTRDLGPLAPKDLVKVRLGRDLVLLARPVPAPSTRGPLPADQTHYQVHDSDGSYLRTLAIAAGGHSGDEVLRQACATARLLYPDRL